MEGLQTEHEGYRGVRAVPNAEQIDAFEALEHPAHGRPIGRLLHLIGDGLAGGRQLLAQAVRGEPVDQQAQQHYQPEGGNALWLPRKMASPVGWRHATPGESATM